MRAVFLRVLESADKERDLRRSILAPPAARGPKRFTLRPAGFSVVPGSPFSYWVSDAIRSLFKRLPPFDPDGSKAKKGLSTAADFRFVRARWEVALPFQTLEWCPFAKGGAFSRFYADIHLLVDCTSNFSQVVAYTDARYPYLSGKSRSLMHADAAHYFQPGITWTYATTLAFSTRALPGGCVFGHGGPSATFRPEDGLPALAVANSLVFGSLVALGLGLAAEGRKNYDIGVVQRTPFPEVSEGDSRALATLARDAWAQRRALDTGSENSLAFTLPALLQSPSGTLAARAATWDHRVRAANSELSAIQAEIDDRCFDLYGISDEDRKAITEGFGATTTAPPIGEAADEEASASALASEVETSSCPTGDDADPDDSEFIAVDATALTADLLSWSIGVAFGRFDLRLATGERALPPEPGPFDPLPVCSPGMLTGANGLPGAAPPTGYPVNVPPDGVLLDDPGHPRDLTGSARTVFDVVFGSDADAHWQEAAGTLDPRNHDLRAFVGRAFFEQHLKRYSKSRRRAPIFWQLATPSASYSVWLYSHRLTPDTFFHVLYDVVAPKLGLEERKLLSRTQDFGPNPTASQRREIAALQTIVDELRAFRDEIARVAPLWRPNLDDGVVLTMAPLWRLVAQHRTWQKELKAAWDSLCAGEYDWAHVAMNLWPERVVPKCATDRSLAIAHGLEEVFWEEDAKGNWTARKTPQTPVADLVVKRTSPAVKAALKDLLEAPVPGGAAHATGRRKRRSG